MSLLVEQSAVGMTGALEALPEFADPPVAEVILAVGFEPAYQDLGCDRIVRCFAEVTSEEIHQEWRRIG